MTKYYNSTDPDNNRGTLFFNWVWGILGIVTLTFFISCLHYFFNLSPSYEQVLYIVNNNDRAVNYFGGTVQKNLFLGDLSVSKDNDIITIKAIFNVYNSKKEGTIDIHLVKIGDKIFVYRLALDSNEDDPIEIIKPTFEMSIDYDKNPSIKNQYFIEDILERVKRDRIYEPVYFIFKRSNEFNDFMQVSLCITKSDTYYILEYKEGFAPGQKEIYINKDIDITRDDVLDILYSYATGTDLFKKKIEWQIINRYD